MRILVIGATGATGRLLVGQLLDRGHAVRVVVRAVAKLPEEIRDHDRLSVTEASVLHLNENELSQQVAGCDAVVSCLGHNLSWSGLFGHPRRLVTEAVRRLCVAVQAGRPDGLVKVVLMNSAGNSNRDIDEPISAAQRLVIALIRRLVPPHADNEQAADYLRTQIGRDNKMIEWTVVRPDSLTDEAAVSVYTVYPSPIRSAIFNSGATSRINVAHFMADLITDDALWVRWRGQMPVIYNRVSTDP